MAITKKTSCTIICKLQQTLFSFFKKRVQANLNFFWFKIIIISLRSFTSRFTIICYWCFLDVLDGCSLCPGLILFFAEFVSFDLFLDIITTQPLINYSDETRDMCNYVQELQCVVTITHRKASLSIWTSLQEYCPSHYFKDDKNQACITSTKMLNFTSLLTHWKKNT